MFGGRNFTVVLIHLVTEWLVAVSTRSKIFQFCFFTIQFRSSSHSSKIVWIIHHFLLGCQSNGRCLSSVSCSWNSRGCAALLMTRGFNFSLVALQHQKTLNLSVDSYTPLHFSPFWIKLFLGICQFNNSVSFALNWFDGGYSFITSAVLLSCLQLLCFYCFWLTR